MALPFGSSGADSNRLRVEGFSRPPPGAAAGGRRFHLPARQNVFAFLHFPLERPDFCLKPGIPPGRFLPDELGQVVVMPVHPSPPFPARDIMLPLYVREYRMSTMKKKDFTFLFIFIVQKLLYSRILAFS
jgi:hypothetical protein